MEGTDLLPIWATARGHGWGSGLGSGFFVVSSASLEAVITLVAKLLVVEQPLEDLEQGSRFFGGAAGCAGPLHPQRSSEGAPHPQAQA